jgi:hypothetical protein
MFLFFAQKHAKEIRKENTKAKTLKKSKETIS